MDSLNKLFEEILLSEETLSIRNEELKKLNSQIRDARKELQSSKKRTQFLRGELAVRNLQASDALVEAEVWRVRNDVALKQRDGLVTAISELSQQLEKAGEEIEKDREQFLKETKEFSQSYDLKGSGKRYREQQTKNEITQIQAEILVLEKELSEMETQKASLRELGEELAIAEASLAEEKSHNEELEGVVGLLDVEIRQVEEELHCLTDKWQNDPEFKRIQRELDICRNSSDLEEAECHRMKADIENLQRENYKKQMTHQRQPQPSTSQRRPQPSTGQRQPQSSTSQSASVSKITQSHDKKHVFSMPSAPKTQVLSMEADEEVWELDEAELASLDVIENFETDDEATDLQQPTANAHQSMATGVGTSETLSPYVLRKRPGESIYKTSLAPGQSSTSAGTGYKPIKKVKFHY